MTKVIRELYWDAVCSCGWLTHAKNDGATVADKVKNHLLTEHVKKEASIVITGHQEVRQRGQLPATGERVG